MGVPLTGWRMTLDELAEAGRPAIVHLRPAHFATLVDLTNGNARWLDSPAGVRVTPLAEFRAVYTGHCLLAPSAKPHAGPAPHLSIPEVDRDAGDVTPASLLVHDFHCRNLGNGPLALAPLSHSPGSSVEVSAGTGLPPGGSARVRLTGLAEDARVLHWAELATNDPERPVVYVTLRARCRPAVSVAPSALMIATRQGSPAARTLWVRGPTDLVVQESAASPSVFEASVMASSERTLTREGLKLIPVVVTLNGKASAGRTTGEVTLRTSDPRTPMLVVPITADVKGEVRLDPVEAFFGLVRAGAASTSTIAATAAGFPDFRVVRVECDLQHVVAGPPVRQDDGSYRAEVRVDPGAPPGVMEGTIWLTTNVPGEERIAVPVYAHVVEK